MTPSHGTTEGLEELLAERQLSRRDHHVSGACRDTVPAVRAAALQRLCVIVRLGAEENHRAFTNHEPRSQCSDLHYSPVSVETEV